MGKQKGNKKCLEVLKVTGVIAASTGTHTHTHTHTEDPGQHWGSRNLLVLAGNPDDLRTGSSRNPLR